MCIFFSFLLSDARTCLHVFVGVKWKASRGAFHVYVGGPHSLSDIYIHVRHLKHTAVHSSGDLPRTAASRPAFDSLALNELQISPKVNPSDLPLTHASPYLYISASLARHSQHTHTQLVRHHDKQYRIEVSISISSPPWRNSRQSSSSCSWCWTPQRLARWSPTPTALRLPSQSQFATSSKPGGAAVSCLPTPRRRRRTTLAPRSQPPPCASLRAAPARRAAAGGAWTRQPAPTTAAAAARSASTTAAPAAAAAASTCSPTRATAARAGTCATRDAATASVTTPCN